MISVCVLVRYGFHAAPHGFIVVLLFTVPSASVPV